MADDDYKCSASVNNLHSLSHRRRIGDSLKNRRYRKQGCVKLSFLSLLSASDYGNHGLKALSFLSQAETVSGFIPVIMAGDLSLLHLSLTVRADKEKLCLYLFSCEAGTAIFINCLSCFTEIPELLKGMFPLSIELICYHKKAVF